MTKSADHTGLSTGFSRPDRVGTVQGERFFDKDLLARCGGSNDLIGMLAVRSGQNHGINAAVFQRILITVTQRNTETLAVILNLGGGAGDSAGHLDGVAFRSVSGLY